MNNNDFSGNNSSNAPQYHATSNLNTAMENPQFNVDNTMGVNIKNSNPLEDTSFNNDQLYQPNMNNQSNNFQTFEDNQLSSNMNNQFNTNHVDNSNMGGVSETSNSQFIPDTTSTQYVPSNSFNSTDTYQEPTVSYEPVMEDKKKNSRFTIPKDLRILVFIVFILIIFIMLMPYIYEFFRKLQLVIVG